MSASHESCVSIPSCVEDLFNISYVRIFTTYDCCDVKELFLYKCY